MRQTIAGLRTTTRAVSGGNPGGTGQQTFEDDDNINIDNTDDNDRDISMIKKSTLSLTSSDKYRKDVDVDDDDHIIDDDDDERIDGILEGDSEKKDESTGSPSEHPSGSIEKLDAAQQ